MGTKELKKIIVALLLVLLGVAGEASAQSMVKLWAAEKYGTITANAGTVVLGSATSNEGWGTIGVTITGTFVGTIAVQCNADKDLAASAYQALRITPTNTTTAVTSVTAPGTWTAGIAGCKAVQAVATAWTSGTAAITLRAAYTGGGSGGGGGGSATASLTLQEADDASIAAGQTADVVIGLGMVYDSTAWKRFTVSAAGSGLSAGLLTIQGNASGTPVPVSVASLPSVAVTNVGVFAAQADLTKVLGATHSATNPIFTRSVSSTGVIADDPAEGSAAGSNAPVPIGCDVEDALSGITALADGNRSKCRTDKDAVIYVRPYGSLADLVNPTVVSNTDGTATQLVAAAGSGIKVYLTSVVCVNTSATAKFVEIKDGSTTKWPLYVPANGSNGAVFQSPLTGTANTAWNFDAESATTTLYCGATGFKSKL